MSLTMTQEEHQLHPIRTKKQLHRLPSRKISSLSFEGRDDRGWTPLHIAARMGNLNEVQRLLDEGVNVNEPSVGKKGPGTTPLHLAAEGGHIQVMDELLGRGADIDARNKIGPGWTPLHVASKVNNKKAIRFLVKNGAFLPPDIMDGRFNPPLHYCGGLEWAYKVREKILKEEEASLSKSSDEGSSEVS